MLSYLFAVALAALLLIIASRPGPASRPPVRPVDLTRAEAIASAVLAALVAGPSVRRHRVIVVLPTPRGVAA